LTGCLAAIADIRRTLSSQQEQCLVFPIKKTPPGVPVWHTNALKLNPLDKYSGSSGENGNWGAESNCEAPCWPPSAIDQNKFGLFFARSIDNLYTKLVLLSCYVCT